MKNFSKYHFIYLVKETVLSNKLIDGIVTDDSVKIDETVHESSDSDSDEENDDSEDKPVSLKMLYKSLGNVILN